MNVGILLKGLRETWLLTLLCGLGAFAFEAIITYIFWIYQEQMTQDILDMELVRAFIGSLIGAEIADEVQLGALNALAWVHPVFLSLLFAHAITATTRMPAGEIDRATIDFFFSQPVSRRNIYLSETFVWLAGGFVVVLLALAGAFFGGAFVPDEARQSPARLLLLVANLYGVYATVGGFSMMVSALSDRRGRAVGIGVGALIAQLLWSFLGQYWDVADTLSFLSILHFFKPMPILADGSIPYGNLAILAVIATSFWVAGAAIFIRRDIRTV